MIAALSLLAFPAFAVDNQVAACSICQTDCYAQYSKNIDDCHWWNITCQDIASAEKNACLGNCLTDVC